MINSQNDAIEFIKTSIDNNHIVLFMKGTKYFPSCGFSAYVVQQLNNLSVEFLDINILDNDILREAVKKYSNWPTLPQLYVKQNFVGGCDIVKSLVKSDKFKEVIKNS